MNKSIMLFSFLCLSITTINAMEDSEWGKMCFATKARQSGTYGFQGCVNKEKCGSYGFYLQTYSPEGLCDECELKQFPERFIACPFCRRPMKKFGQEQSSLCLGCESEVQNIIVNLLKINNDWQHVHNSLLMGSFSYLNESAKNISRKYIAALKTDCTDLTLRYGFLGFYRGAIQLENGNMLHVWNKNLHIESSDKKFVLTQEDAKDLIDFIFNKYKLFGPETGEITLQEIPEGSIVYEEVIIKK